MKLTKFNINFSVLLITLLLVEMIFSSLANFYVIRFLQFFLLINFFFRKFKILKLDLVFLIIIIQFIFYAAGSFNNQIVLSELATVVWWYCFMCVLNDTIVSVEIFNDFKIKLFKLFSWVSTISAILGIIKLYLLSKGIILPFMESTLPNGDIVFINGSSLNIDYNIYSIGLLLGVFSSVYCYNLYNTKGIKIFYTFCVLLQLLAAGLSSSRRGLVLSLFVFSVLIIWNKTFMTNKIKTIRLQNKKQFLYISILFIVSAFLYIDVDLISNSSSQIEGLSNRLKTIETINSSENNLRTIRWEYALKYYEERSWLEKLFGSGFEYLYSFGINFKDSISDHPHNVWISSLLYGGVIGFILTIVLTINLFYKFYNYRSYLSFFISFFLLFNFLNFTSSNSIFSSRLYMVIMLLPFLHILKYNNNNNKQYE